MKSFRVGIIGYGLSGKVFHAPLITAAEGLELVKIVSARPEQVHKDLPFVEVVSTVEQLLEDSTIDLVVVTTPNSTHYSFIKQALEAGKHVIAEKPFVNTVAEADELIAMASERKVVLSVFQNRRWDNDYLSVKKCIQEGLLGDICTFEAHFDMFRPVVSTKWKEHAGDGSGALYDLGSHLIDQVLQLFGMPDTVYCDLVCQRPGAEVDDYFHLVLGYGKMRVVLQSSAVVKQAGPHFQVHGTKGSFVKFGMDPQQSQLQQGLRPGSVMWGKDREEWYGELTIGTEITALSRIETIPGSYETYYRGIYESLAYGKNPPVTARDGRQVIEVIEYALQSFYKQKMIVISK